MGAVKVTSVAAVIGRWVAVSSRDRNRDTEHPNGPTPTPI
jgi:hypothetical protein